MEKVEKIQIKIRKRKIFYSLIINRITIHKRHCEVNIIIQNENFELIALIDSGIDISCIQETLKQLK